MLKDIQLPSQFLQYWMNNNLLQESEQIFNDYYKSYINNFPKRMQYFYNRQLEDALKIISSMVNPKVLEIGCGLGSESLFMSLKGADVLGIDIRDDRISAALKRKEVIEKDLNIRLNCDFKNISILDLDEENKYDMLWMEQAYHHLEPRESVSEKIAKLLKPNGYLIISEANAWNLMIQAILFKQRGFATIKHYIDSSGEKHVYGNERILTPASLINNFRKFGIQKIDVKYFRLFPNMKIFQYLFELEKRFPAFLFPLFTHYNYIGRKSGL